ncbi:MAG: hypothetical protein HQ564_06795 [Candidatus Saganbacteria bacterium]|nr:hypothetical protein [Candidatus Saganbacteria bacterium]
MSNPIQICVRADVKKPNPEASVHAEILKLGDLWTLLQMLDKAVVATGSDKVDETLTKLGKTLTSSLGVYGKLSKAVPDWTATRKVEGTIIAMAQRLKGWTSGVIKFPGYLSFAKVSKDPVKIKKWLSRIRYKTKAKEDSKIALWIKNVKIAKLVDIYNRLSKNSDDRPILADLITLVKMRNVAVAASKVIGGIARKNLTGVSDAKKGAYDSFSSVHKTLPQRKFSNKNKRTIFTLLRKYPKIAKNIGFKDIKAGFNPDNWLKNLTGDSDTKYRATRKKIADTIQAIKAKLSKLCLSPKLKKAVDAAINAAKIELVRDKGRELHYAEESDKWYDKADQWMRRNHIMADATLYTGAAFETEDLSSLGKGLDGNSAFYLKTPVTLTWNPTTPQHAWKVGVKAEYEGLHSGKDYKKGEVALFSHFRRTTQKGLPLEARLEVGGIFADSAKSSPIYPSGSAFYVDGNINFNFSREQYKNWALGAGARVEAGEWDQTPYLSVSPRLGVDFRVKNSWTFGIAARYNLLNRDYFTSWDDSPDAGSRYLGSESYHRAGVEVVAAFNRPRYSIAARAFVDASLSGQEVTGGFDVSAQIQLKKNGKHLLDLSTGYQKDDYLGPIRHNVKVLRAEYLYQGHAPLKYGVFAQVNVHKHEGLLNHPDAVATAVVGPLVRFGLAKQFRRPLRELTSVNDQRREAFVADFSRTRRILNTLVGAERVDEKYTNLYAFAFANGLIQSDYKLDLKAAEAQYAKLHPKAKDLPFIEKIEKSDIPIRTYKKANSPVLQGDVVPIALNIGIGKPVTGTTDDALAANKEYRRSTRMMTAGKKKLLKIAYLRNKVANDFKSQGLNEADWKKLIKLPSQASHSAADLVYAISQLSGLNDNKFVLEAKLKELDPKLAAKRSILERDLRAGVVTQPVLDFAVAAIKKNGGSVLSLTSGLHRKHVDTLLALAGKEIKAAPKKKDETKGAEKAKGKGAEEVKDPTKPLDKTAATVEGEMAGEEAAAKKKKKGGK